MKKTTWAYKLEIRTSGKGMKKTIRKKIVKSMLACSLFASPPSMATIPVADGLNLGEAIVTNINIAANWVSEGGLMTVAMELESYYSMAQMTLDANLGQLTLQKELKLNENLHNLWVKELLKADENSAKDCAIQELSDAVDCNQLDENAKRLDILQAKETNFTKSPTEARLSKKLAYEKIINECRNLTYAVANKDSDDLSVSLCLRGGILTGAEASDNFTPDEQVAAEKIIDIMSGVGIEHKKSQSMPKGSIARAEEINREVRYLAFKSLAVSSLEQVAGMRKAASSNSSMQVSSQLSLLQTFDDERWGDEDWKLKVAMTVRDPDDGYSVSQLQRIQTKMQAFQVHLEIIKYKQQLRMEALQAATLVLNVEDHFKN